MNRKIQPEITHHNFLLSPKYFTQGLFSQKVLILHNFWFVTRITKMPQVNNTTPKRTRFTSQKLRQEDEK